MALNNISIMGRLTADPEVKTTQSGDSVCKFTVAVDRPMGKDKSKEKETDWIPVVVWGSTAQFVSNYFRKGSMIALTGSIQTFTYEDKEGNRRSGFNVKADRVSFCGSKEENSAKDKPASEPKPAIEIDDDNGDGDDEDDALPF